MYKIKKEDTNFIIKILDTFYVNNRNIIAYKMRKDQIEIQLTDYCNLKCVQCNVGCDIVESNKYVSLENVEKFVKDLIDLNVRMRRVSITGGEPTLHPLFFDVIDILKKYKDFNDDRILLRTNGWGEEVLEIIAKLPSWVGIDDSTGRGMDYKVSQFSLFRVAPVDLKCFNEYGEFNKGCKNVGEGCSLMGCTTLVQWRLL